MWLFCVLAFISLEVVVSKNVLRMSNEDTKQIVPLPLPVPLDDRTLDYLDKGLMGDRNSRWPLGIVSYYFDNSSYDFLVAERVRLAMNSIEETSCVKFKPILEPWSENYWIHITNKERVRHCTHETAETGNGLEIIMTMGIDCLQRREILHLLMHALGFKDEITHPQRDQYVRILWDNINPSYRQLFQIQHVDFPSRTTEYDPTSIMHFHDRAYTRNGQATIASLIPGLVISPSRELSPLDKMKLRLMFGHECNRREVGDLLDSCKNAMQDGKLDDKGDEIDIKEKQDENDEGGNDDDVNNDVNEENGSEEDRNEEDRNGEDRNEENGYEENTNQENENNEKQHEAET